MSKLSIYTSHIKEEKSEDNRSMLAKPLFWVAGGVSLVAWYFIFELGAFLVRRFA